MPWCEACDRFLNPPSLTAAGECPSCGRVLADPPGAPWHFKLLLVALVLYLGFRAWQGIVWVAERT